MSELWHALSGSLGFWTALGSSVGVSVAYGIKRFIDWNYPPGHHSKRVQRYGVRDDHPTEESTDDP